jgi:hypothetical protein
MQTTTLWFFKLESSRHMLRCKELSLTPYHLWTASFFVNDLFDLRVIVASCGYFSGFCAQCR